MGIRVRRLSLFLAMNEASLEMDGTGRTSNGAGAPSLLCKRKKKEAGGEREKSVLGPTHQLD
uniref:Predicted protein n=1 Tax=Hordeum vulgare subsp. vulgare TaxID=112509 RepID=F2DCG1_HORVV|nr:predicted protein [Hordeum vulgare subsp. vulgare]BAK02159.1 predicted protein [Hordeum vulgare subsp. vulgare]